MTSSHSYQHYNSKLTMFTRIELCLEFPSVILGSLMFLVIIHFERYGGDPMKRSIANKLVSAISVSSMTTMTFTSIFHLYRVFIGGFHIQLALVITLGQIFGILMIMMNLIGFFTFKCMRLLAFHFANRLDEDFWFWSFEVFSIFICLTLTTLEYVIAETPMPLVFVWAGHHPWESKSMVRVLFGLIGVGAFVTLFAHFCLSIWKKSTNSIEPIQINQPAFNVISYNPTMLSDLQFLAVAFTFILSGSFPFLLQRGKPPETADELLLLWMPLRITTGVVAPFLFYAFNKELRLYCKREFWNFAAPDFLQKYNPNLITIIASSSQVQDTVIEMIDLPSSTEEI